MRTNWLFLLMLVPALYLSSCKKDDDEVVPDEPDTPEYVAPETTELMISEISVISRADIPGTGNQRNTYIELYNGTNDMIDLSEFVMLYSNNDLGWGEREGDTLFMSGMLNHGETYVILRKAVDPAESTFPTDKADIIWDNLTANGDDGIALAKSDGEGGYDMIDVFGSDIRPTEAWPMCGVTEGSKDAVLQRKYEVTGPTVDWDLSSGVSGTCQWDSYAPGTYDNVKLPTGYH